MDKPRLIRRLYTTRVPLPRASAMSPTVGCCAGWRGAGREGQRACAISGWWWKQPVERDYHFAETKTGENLWVFYDRGKNRWFLQGELG